MDFNFLKRFVSFQQKNNNFYPHFRSGCTVRVHCLVDDSKKQRTQIFEGVVLSIKGNLNNRNFLVRKSTGNYSVEKRFFYNSPLVTKIEVVRFGKVRRAKIYYLRKLRGKAARIKQIIKINSNSKVSQNSN